MCHNLADAYADTPRLEAVAMTLGVTIEAANQAFAQYIPRDAVEADIVEQILLARARIHAATRRVFQPDLSPAAAAKADRVINIMTKELRILIQQLDQRQNRFTGQLPQQYWRTDSIRAVGPIETEAAPEPPREDIPGPQPAWPESAATTPAETSSARATPARATPAGSAPAWADAPIPTGDALARFASMRISPDMPAQDAWMSATRDAAQPVLNRKLRRAQDQRRAA
jgi:hypothetical protein